MNTCMANGAETEVEAEATTRTRQNVPWDASLDAIVRLYKDKKTPAEIGEFINAPEDAIRKRLIEIAHDTEVYTYLPFREWSEDELHQLEEFIQERREDYESPAHDFKRTYGAIKTQVSCLKRKLKYSGGNGNGNHCRHDLSDSQPAHADPSYMAILAEMKKQTAALEQMSASLVSFCTMWKK